MSSSPPFPSHPGTPLHFSYRLPPSPSWVRDAVPAQAQLLEATPETLIEARNSASTAPQQQRLAQCRAAATAEFIEAQVLEVVLGR